MPVSIIGNSGIQFPDSSLQAAAASPFGLKNRIINGDMVVSQRNGTSSVTPNNSYTLDRWATTNTQTSKFTIQQNAGSVTPPTGFTNYLGVTSSSAYSVATGDTFAINQSIEGFNVADLSWGTANAQTVTLSFWVRSSLTGTFGGSITNGSLSYPFSYTISSANTWEKETITIVGPTTGTWATNNTSGFTLYFGLGSGATFSGTAGAWIAGNFVQSTGSQSVVGTNGATWYITGIQLERNTTATPFEWIPYGTELALCQRYFQVFGNISGNGSIGAFNPIGQGQGVTTNSAGQYSIFLPVSMRTSPSIGISTTASAFSVTSPSDGNTACTSVPTANIGGPNMIRVAAFCTTAGFMTVGAGNILFANSSTPAWVSAAAEL